MNRRARRAKTDCLDVGKLLALLLRSSAGSERCGASWHVPSAEAEAQRQLTREIETVRMDRKRVRNRIQECWPLKACRGVRRVPRDGADRGRSAAGGGVSHPPRTRVGAFGSDRGSPSHADSSPRRAHRDRHGSGSDRGASALYSGEHPAFCAVDFVHSIAISYGSAHRSARQVEVPGEHVARITVVVDNRTDEQGLLTEPLMRTTPAPGTARIGPEHGADCARRTARIIAPGAPVCQTPVGGHTGTHLS